MAIQFVCANCGIEFKWQPTVVDGGTYCCPGCAMGGPCNCDYSNLPRLGEFRAVMRSTRVIVLPPPSASTDSPMHDPVCHTAEQKPLERDESE